MKKGIIINAIIIILLFVGYLFISPYLTISKIKEGIQKGDSEILSEKIDFSSLRQNLKEQINIIAVDRISTDLKDNPFAAIGMLLASKMVDAMVDSMVTPTGLAYLTQGKVKNERGLEDDSNKSESKEIFPNAKYSFESLSKFSISVPSEQDGEVKFILRRGGLNWKLSQIILPINKEAVPAAGKSFGETKRRAVKSQIELFETALDALRLDTGRYPTSSEGLEALRKKPEGFNNWKGPYLPISVPKDPWGNDYRYYSPGKSGEYDIICYGRDNKLGGEGEDADITN